MRTLFFIIFSFIGGAGVGHDSNKIVIHKIGCEQSTYSRMQEIILAILEDI
jgi:hypothetical protein